MVGGRRRGRRVCWAGDADGDGDCDCDGSSEGDCEGSSTARPWVLRRLAWAPGRLRLAVVLHGHGVALDQAARRAHRRDGVRLLVARVVHRLGVDLQPEVAQVGGDLVDVAAEVVALVDPNFVGAELVGSLGVSSVVGAELVGALLESRRRRVRRRRRRPCVTSQHDQHHGRDQGRAPAARSATGCGAPRRAGGAIGPVGVRRGHRQRAAAGVEHLGALRRPARDVRRLGHGRRVAQRGGERVAVGVPLGRVLRHRPAYDGGQVRRDGRRAGPAPGR